MYRKKLKLYSVNNVTDGGEFAVHRYRAVDQLMERATVNPHTSTVCWRTVEHRKTSNHEICGASTGVCVCVCVCVCMCMCVCARTCLRV